MRVGRWFSVLPPGGGEKWGTRCLGRPAAGLTEHTVQLRAAELHLLFSTEHRAPIQLCTRGFTVYGRVTDTNVR